MCVGPPDTSLVVNTSKEGTFSIKLFGVDMAGNVQQRPTLFSWTTDRSTLFLFLLSLSLPPPTPTSSGDGVNGCSYDLTTAYISLSED